MMLNIIVALTPEAKPLCEYFKLKRITSENLPFPIFVNKEKNIHLIISGLGKIKMAVAAAFLQSYTQNFSYTCFLNVGIAGSAEFPIGEFVLANKLSDMSAHRHYYPFVPSLKFSNTHLMTFDSPQSFYPNKGMVDMEASGFFEAANRFVTLEQIMVAKIISDNDAISRNRLDRNKAEELIGSRIKEIEMLIHYLGNLSQQEKSYQNEPTYFQEFLQRHHFTHSQSLQLKENLRRWQTLYANENPLLHCENKNSAADIIHALTLKLDAYANRLS